MKAATLFAGASALVAVAATAVAIVTHHSPSASRAAAASPIPAALAADAPPQSYEDFNVPYDGLFHFVRVRYGGGGGGGGGFGFRRRRGGGAMWAHDWPRAERNFLKIMDETTFVRAQTEGSNIVTLDDPELFQYPVAYIVEVGSWNPTDEEAEKLGEYLHKGGFLIVDDFRDRRNLDNFEFQLSRVLPGMNMVMVDETNDIFDSFFRIVPEEVIPPYGGGAPIWYGVYEDNDVSKRLMMIVNYNNDIAEYWEFSDRGYYPIDLANEAYKLGVNYVVYGLTH